MNYEEIKANTIKTYNIKVTIYLNEKNEIIYMLDKDDGWVIDCSSFESAISDLKMLGCEF